MPKLPREKGRDIATNSQSIGGSFQLVYSGSLDSVLQRQERLHPVQNTLKALCVSAVERGQAVVEKEGRRSRSEPSHSREQRRQESQKTSNNQPARQGCQSRRTQPKSNGSPGPPYRCSGPRSTTSDRMVQAWVCCRGDRLQGCGRSPLGTQPRRSLAHNPRLEPKERGRQ